MSLASQYNDWHQRVFDSAPEHEDGESPWYSLVLERLVPIEGKRVLEVACGRGGFARLLASRGAVMFGADFSGTALQIAQSRVPANGEKSVHMGLAQTDAQQLPYSDESFDIIISCETIEHLPCPGSALREMWRVCRTGGLLYLTTPNYFNAMGLYYVYASLRGRPSTPGSDQPTDHVFLFPEIRRLVKQAGWAIVRSDGTIHQFPIRPGHNPMALPSLESNRSVRRILSPLAFHYFLMAKKNKER
jgi:2-polyprenyl-3-methyl-5-hydroxy-6-metoxy-1,4-benzoquinol methylase